MAAITAQPHQTKDHDRFVFVRIARPKRFTRTDNAPGLLLPRRERQFAAEARGADEACQSNEVHCSFRGRSLFSFFVCHTFGACHFWAMRES